MRIKSECEWWLEWPIAELGRLDRLHLFRGLEAIRRYGECIQFWSCATGTIASCFGTSGLNETARLRGGHFAMTVSTLFPAATNNSLTLQGVQNSKGNIARTWTSSRQPSCAATGNFSMTGVPPV
jgi:hypothetical protein